MQIDTDVQRVTSARSCIDHPASEWRKVTLPPARPRKANSQGRKAGSLLQIIYIALSKRSAITAGATSEMEARTILCVSAKQMAPAQGIPFLPDHVTCFLAAPSNSKYNQSTRYINEGRHVDAREMKPDSLVPCPPVCSRLYRHPRPNFKKHLKPYN
jgi:hypothetical protein